MVVCIGVGAATIEEHAMQVQAETYVDRNGVEKLRRIHFDGRQIEIAENIDQWHGADYRYFKVRGSDGSLYIFCNNETRGDWEMTMYEHAIAGRSSDR